MVNVYGRTEEEILATSPYSSTYNAALPTNYTQTPQPALVAGAANNPAQNTLATPSTYISPTNPEVSANQPSVDAWSATYGSDPEYAPTAGGNTTSTLAGGEANPTPLPTASLPPVGYIAPEVVPEPVKEVVPKVVTPEPLPTYNDADFYGLQKPFVSVDKTTGEKTSYGFAEVPTYNSSGNMLPSYANSQQVKSQGILIPTGNSFAQGGIDAFTSFTNFITGASKPLANTSLNTTPLTIPAIQSNPTVKSLPVLAPTAAYESNILSTPTPSQSFTPMSYYTPINITSTSTSPTNNSSSTPASTSSQSSTPSPIPTYISDQYNSPSPIPEAVVNIPSGNIFLPITSSQTSKPIPKETIITSSKTFDVTPKLSSSYISNQFNKPSPIPTAVVNIPSTMITNSPFSNRVMQQPIVNQVKRIQPQVMNNQYTMMNQPQHLNNPYTNMNMSLFNNRENINNIKQNVKNKIIDIFKNMENDVFTNKKKRR